MLLRRFALLLLSVALATPARAEDAPSQFDERRAVYTRGLSAMLKQNWVEAERIFAELFRTQRTWDVAVSLGQSELNLKRYREAAEHLSYGVQNFPIRDKRDAYEDAKAGLEEAKRHVGTLTITVNQDAAGVRVDGSSVGRSPLAQPVFVEPGKHTVEASLDGYTDASQALLIEAGASETVTLSLGARTPPVPLGTEAHAAPRDRAEWAVSPEARPAPNLIPAIVGGALALGGAGLFLGFTLAANQNDDTLAQFRKREGANACVSPAPSLSIECADVDREGRAYDRNRNLATTGLVVAGTAVLGTLAYYLFVPPPKTAASSGIPGVLRATRVAAGFSSSAANLDLAYSF